jgi:hypothetical protein
MSWSPYQTKHTNGGSDDRPDKTVSLRLSNRQQNELENLVEILDCDKSSAVRPAIRLLNLALSGHNTALTITQRDGAQIKVLIVIDGVRFRCAPNEQRPFKMTIPDPPDRAYFDESLGKYADEHLEVVFKQIYEWQVEGEQGNAIAILLDPYTNASFGDAAVAFDGALQDIDHAVRWSSQFGDVRVSAIDAQSANADQLGSELGSDMFGSKIENDQFKHLMVFGKTVHQAILLAGVQVLREFAHEVLNRSQNETAH